MTLCYGTFLGELSAGPQNGLLISGFYLIAVGFQRWFFGARYFDPSRKKRIETASEDQIVFEGRSVDTHAGAEHEKKSLDRVFQVSVQVRVRLASFTLIGMYAFLVTNHIFTMHSSLVLHLIASLLLIPAMAPNHFILPLVLNVASVTYCFVVMDT